MIAVIADDLTGAAEIGGIGLQHGLQVAIASHVDTSTSAELLVINTDARSKSEADAVTAAIRACKDLKALNPDFIYKKTDSILRGHVLAELQAEMETLGLHKALLVPANPALNRTLVNRLYYIGATPVHQTAFAHDPEFPIAEADVVKMLRGSNDHVAVHHYQQGIADRKITVGEAAVTADLKQWAQQVTPDILPAGASGFFTALLGVKYPRVVQTHTFPQWNSPILYVSGTTFSASSKPIKELHAAGGPVVYMPVALMHMAGFSELLLQVWADDVITKMNNNGKAVIAIDQDECVGKDLNARYLRNMMALLLAKLFIEAKIGELIVEGGSTADAILKALDINALYPLQQLAPGVIRSSTGQHQNLNITLKPGSYAWGDELRNILL